MSKDVALAEGALAFALLIGLQFIVTWSSVRARWVRKWVTGEPLIVLYRGEFLPAALLSSRVAEDEVRAAVRSAGLASMNEAEAVVLETDGSFSVVRRGGEGLGCRIDVSSSSCTGSVGDVALPRGCMRRAGVIAHAVGPRRARG